MLEKKHELEPNIILFITGIVLLLIPLFFVVMFPDQIISVQFYLRLIASLGGALIGVWLPGLLHINIPGIRAGGALAVLVLLWQFNPPALLNQAINPEPKGFKASVLLMDSSAEKLVFCEHTQKINGSNTDDITDLLNGLPVLRHTIHTNLEWQDDEHVKALNPDLIVIHASAFYERTKRLEANQRLLDFIANMSNQKARFLVYTRGLPEQPSESLRRSWDDLMNGIDMLNDADKIALFIMPEREKGCFSIPDNGRPFKAKIMNMLGLR